MEPTNDPNGVDRRRFLLGVAAGAAGLSLTGGARGRAHAADGEAEEGKGAGQKADRVRTRTLGRTGIAASVISFGGASLGNRPDQIRLLRGAYDRGITLFDTAWGYTRGQSEQAVGELVKGVKDREKLVICTKASGFRVPRGSSKEVYRALKERVGAHLERLGTDYIDIYMWPHGASSPAALGNKAMQEALRKLREEKLIRFLGTSSHQNYAETLRAAVRGGFYDVIMPVMNASTQTPGEGGKRIEDTGKLLREARRKKVGIIAMKVVNPGYHREEVDAVLPDAPGMSRAQRMIAHILSQEGVATAVVSIRNLTHLKEAVAVGVKA